MVVGSSERVSTQEAPAAQLILLLQNRWRILAIGLILGLLAGVLLTLLSPSRYQASVTLYVAAQGGDQNTSAAYQGGLLAEQRVKSYSELVTSDRVLNEAITDGQLGETTANLRQSTTTSTETDTTLLRIAVESSSPDRASLAANAVANSTIALVNEIELPRDPRQSPSVTVRAIEPAPIPTDAVSPRPSLNLLVGGLAGVLLGFAAAYAAQSLDTTIRGTDRLAEVARKPVLASLFLDSEATPDSPLAMIGRPTSPTAEAYRKLRTSLLYLAVDTPDRVLLVTSAVQGEGKTTTTCNLAVSLSDAGSRVLIVDGDLRRPQVAHYFGLDSAVGLTSVLAGQTDVVNAMHARVRPSLDVLVSGRIPPNPSELVSSNQMAELIRHVAKNYDYVLIDAPPVLPVTDATAMANLSTGVVFLVSFKATKITQVRAAVETLERSGGRVMGCVLTKAPLGEKRLGYYGYESVHEVQSGGRVPATQDNSALHNRTHRTPAHRGDSDITQPRPYPHPPIRDRR